MSSISLAYSKTQKQMDEQYLINELEDKIQRKLWTLNYVLQTMEYAEKKNMGNLALNILHALINPKDTDVRDRLINIILSDVDDQSLLDRCLIVDFGLTDEEYKKIFLKVFQSADHKKKVQLMKIKRCEKLIREIHKF